MKPRILIDANSLCWKAKHSLRDLSYEELKTGVIFGFLGQILRIATDYETNDISFCWDSKRNFRTDIFPEYKIKRKQAKEEKTDEEIEEDRLAYLQFDLLYEEVIGKLGVTNNYKIEGYEGDDLLASIVYANNDDFIIVTGDEDMFQLLSEGVSIRRSRLNRRGKKEYYLYTEQMFTEEYRITPSQWIDVKAIAGCKSDEVPGVPGVGPDTAIKYLLGEMTPNLKRYQAISSPNGKTIRKRNEALVTLPFHDCPEIKLKPQFSWSWDGFINVCNTYEFQYYLRQEELNKWKKNLNLK